MPSRATSDSPKTVDTSSTKRKRRSDADATDKRTRTSDRFRGQFIVYRACWDTADDNQSPAVHHNGAPQGVPARRRLKVLCRSPSARRTWVRLLFVDRLHAVQQAVFPQALVHRQL